jgi:hypothetical protein
MPIAFNGSGTISGISTGGISDAKAVADAAMPAGAILQMQSTLKTDYSSMNNTSFSDIGGLSVSITPIFSNSKIIVTLTCAIGHKNNEYGSIKIVQNIPVVKEYILTDHLISLILLGRKELHQSQLWR